MSDTRSRKFKTSRTALRAGAIFLVMLLIAAAGAFAYLDVGPDRISYGVKIGNVSLGGKNTEEATALLKEKFSELTLTYALPGLTVTIYPAKSDASGAGNIAKFNIQETVQNALLVGKGSSLRDSFELARVAIFGKNSRDFALYTIDEDALHSTLTNGMKGKVAELEDAHLSVRAGNNALPPTITISKERDGLTIDYAEAVKLTLDRIATLDDAPIVLDARKAAPRLTQADIEPLKDGVASALGRAPLTLSLKGKTWSVSRSLLADWMVAVPEGDDSARLGLDAAKMSKYMESRTADLSTVPKNAVFEMKDGKVTKFSPSENGEKLDIATSLRLVENAVFGKDAVSGPIALAMTIALPDIETGKSNEFGIREIIGVGSTNFKGSPKNRRHNIAVGAKSVDGTLIAPNEEFSLLKTLGAIDASTGYLEELVIKENKTTPEFGGGLCQIGSTAFRGALDSGLPITARQNHSYRVPYYERAGDGSFIGPGKDATIYDPAPDFKFLNDTGHHMLIMTNIEGNKLTFTFWGIKDGRTSEQTSSRVYNVVPPPEKKVVDTTDLKPGEEKCTEHAHDGSDAVFTYTVTYPSKEKKVVDFKSHYKPWQEVCLRGVDPSQLPIANEGATIPSLDAAGATGN